MSCRNKEQSDNMSGAGWNLQNILRWLNSFGFLIIIKYLYF